MTVSRSRQFLQCQRGLTLQWRISDIAPDRATGLVFLGGASKLAMSHDLV